MIYMHYKGGLYTRLFNAFNSTNSADRDEMVVYVSHTTGGIYVRELDEFEQLVSWPDGTVNPRFKPIREYRPPEREEKQ